MTKKQAEKFHSLRLIWALGCGIIEALLLTRLAIRLLAVRLESSLWEWIALGSDLLIQPLRSLDAAQPQFGAILELSTLTLAICVPMIGYLGWWLLSPKNLIAPESIFQSPTP